MRIQSSRGLHSSLITYYNHAVEPDLHANGSEFLTVWILDGFKNQTQLNHSAV